MDFFWIYDIKNWQLALLILSVFISFNVFGYSLVKKFIINKINVDSHNDLVSFFMSSIGAIFGISLGLIAVGAWENFNSVDQAVTQEAAADAALFRDISFYPSPTKDSLQAQLKDYTNYVINKAWPLQRQGIIPIEGTNKISIFQKTLYSFEPIKQSEIVIHTEAIQQFNKLIEYRRMRLQSVETGLSGPIWFIIFFGAFLNIAITWFFKAQQKWMHILLGSIFASLLGSLIFLIAIMDYPYRGYYSVSSQAFELVYNSLMK